MTAAAQVIAPALATTSIAEVTHDMLTRITIYAAPTERAEAEFVVHAIEKMIGGHSFFYIDSGRTTTDTQTDFFFADFAVLYRTYAQSIALCDTFARSGMPFQKHGHEPLMENPLVRAIVQELDREAR